MHMTKKASDIIDIFAAAMLEQKKLREERESEGVPALLKLVKAAKEGGGQAHHLRRFLLGLYHSHDWPFELDRLRALDTHLQQAALQVLALDWNGNEIHTYIENGDELFHSWWVREQATRS